MYCNTLVSIAGCRRQNCVAIQNCIATERQGAGQGRAGRRWGTQVGVRGVQAARLAGAGRHGAGGARSGRAGSRWALGVGCRRSQQASGSRRRRAAAGAAGARGELGVR